jgi:hypothetical protein
MSTRTTNTIVPFSAYFELPGIDGIHPAGDYKIAQNEELIAFTTGRSACRDVHSSAVDFCRPPDAAPRQNRSYSSQTLIERDTVT